MTLNPFRILTTLALLSQLVCVAISSPAEDPKPLFVDDFDGQIADEWTTIRPDATHVSLTSHPGQLTITTQLGAILGDARRRNTPLTRNIHLIDNPVDDGGDFAVTVSVASFGGTMKYQQAGLLIYDDDDNFVKCDLESNGSKLGFKFIRETDAFRFIDTDKQIEPADRVWIRVTKRGNVYERSYSTDGETFDSGGEAVWGNGSPASLGLVACNGPNVVDEIDARFDSFEVRLLTPAEEKQPAYEQRKKLTGQWEVQSTKASGVDAVTNPITDFEFQGGKVSFRVGEQVTNVDYLLNPGAKPKKLVLSSLTPDAKEPVNGNYSLEGDDLVLCFALPPGTPEPGELKTEADDKRLLITLKRREAL